MRQRRPGIAAWLAILAVSLNALWPLIAQARPSNAILVPVCAIGGEAHYESIPVGKTPIERHTAAHQEHCSCCCVTGLPPSSAAPIARDASRTEPPQAVESAFPRSAVSLLRRSRAPPSAS